MKKRNGFAPFATSTLSGSIAIPREAAERRRGRLAQLGQPGRLAVVRLAGPDRGDPSLGHVRRRLEVGLADLEVDDVPPGRLERAGTREHGERPLGAEPPDGFGEARSRRASPPSARRYIVLDWENDHDRRRHALRNGRVAMLLAAIAWSSAGLAQRELDATPATQVVGRALFAFFALLAVVA